MKDFNRQIIRSIIFSMYVVGREVFKLYKDRMTGDRRILCRRCEDAPATEMLLVQDKIKYVCDECLSSDEQLILKVLDTIKP